MFQRKKFSDKTYTVDEIVAKMEHFCAWQERAPHEVWEKLCSFRLPEAEAGKIYEVLEQDGFFNEQRFAESFVRGKFRANRWGRIRIRQELKMRRVATEIIESALENIAISDYKATIKQLIDKKMAQYGSEDPRARDKTAASLIRAGFEPDLVFKYMATLKNRNTDD
jgi:regulatory protein